VARETACREGKTRMKADIGKGKVIFFYMFEVILHKAEGEEVQVRTSDKKGDSLETERHLQEQSRQRR